LCGRSSCLPGIQGLCHRDGVVRTGNVIAPTARCDDSNVYLPSSGVLAAVARAGRSPDTTAAPTPAGRYLLSREHRQQPQRTWCKPAAVSTLWASSAGTSLSERSISVLSGWRAAAATAASTWPRPNSRAD